MHKSWGGRLHPKTHVLPTPWAPPCPVAGITRTPASHAVCLQDRCGEAKAPGISLRRYFRHCGLCSCGPLLGDFSRGAGCAEAVPYHAPMFRTPPLSARWSRGLCTHTRAVWEAWCQCKFAHSNRTRPYVIPSCISVILWREARKGAPAEVKAGCSHSLQCVKGRAAQLEGAPGRGSGGLEDGRDFASGKTKMKETWLPIKGSSAQL